MLSLRGGYFWLGKKHTFAFAFHFYSWPIISFLLLSKHCICICIIVFVFVFLPNSILYAFKRVRGSVPVSSHVMFVQSSLFLLLATKTKLVADLDGQLPLASLRAGDSWAIHPASAWRKLFLCFRLLCFLQFVVLCLFVCSFLWERDAIVLLGSPLIYCLWGGRELFPSRTKHRHRLLLNTNVSQDESFGAKYPHQSEVTNLQYGWNYISKSEVDKT